MDAKDPLHMPFLDKCDSAPRELKEKCCFEGYYASAGKYGQLTTISAPGIGILI
ncbi:hypothetical protein PGT21_021258 [Puccinia graminis f. sp. tritici]|uniref:Uncharacterized protein n=1 Tax=Puccinia graminis f. sp. tritici TaxID=56615 RepID=A0A5B0M775_PUCGR|nr:hypothetical protein PGTUg99_004449 [Puccinia graminis f. sp. tritici]KAA1071850.1 hypothetical protein PGT21_021258 [Puccinia graminis f. sp. tritici]